MITQLSILLFSDFDAETLISDGGLLIICLAVFAQTGLFFCFFVPSGMFLLTGGMFVATGRMNHDIITVCICSVLSSVLACVVAYWFGWETGPALYKRKDSKFFRQKYLKAAETFYNKHGLIAMTLALWFPLTRTFAPIVAGMVKMNFSRFIFSVSIGSALWIPAFLMSGYLMGSIPGISEYLNYIMVVIILVVTVPVLLRVIREFKNAGNDDSKT